MNVAGAAMLHGRIYPLAGSASRNLAASRRLSMSLLPAALFLLAQAATAGPAESSEAVYGPASPEPARPAAPVAKTAESGCPAPAAGDPKNGPIIVCAIKPQGYRIDPDVLAARRMKKKGDPGPPRNPHETYVDHSCANVGPMGCRFGPTIDLAAAALTAATMVEKAVKGENVGQMFVTDPTRNEYQLYLEAKREREAKQQQRAAQAVADAVKAEKAAKTAQPQTAPAEESTQPAK
jgi:hypothetical protein